MLCRVGRVARSVQADPRQVQGLRGDPEGERLPVAAHDAVRTLRHAARGADPYPRHASHRRGWRCRTLAIQGGGQAGHCGSPATDASLAAKPARDSIGITGLEGISRAHQGRSLPGRDLCLHAQGQDHGAAARRDGGRLRLRGAHRHRPSLHGGENQLRTDAPAHGIEER